MSSTFPQAVYNFIAFIFLILSFFSSSGKYTLNNMFEKVLGDIYYFCNWFWFWAQRKQKDQNSVSKMGTFIFRNLWFITWSRYLKTEHGSFAQGCISLSFQVVLFWCLMENFQVKTSSTIVKVLGVTGTHNATSSGHDHPRHRLLIVRKDRDLLQHKPFKKTYSIPWTRPIPAFQCSLPFCLHFLA